MSSGDLVPIAFFVMIGVIVAVVVLGPAVLRYLEKGRLHETVRLAFDKGQPVPPEMIAALQSRSDTPVVGTPDGDLRRGVRYVAVALGILVFACGLGFGLSGQKDESAAITAGVFSGIAAIPGFLGLGHLVLWYLRRDRAQG
jgi:hypothetical protein